MRKAWLLLALAGCDNQDADEQAQPGLRPASAQLPALPTDGSAASPAQLEGRARASLRAIIADPDTMRFGSLRAGAAGSVCGDVEGKQPDGKRAVRPFVITPEGVAVVSTTPQVSIQDPEDPFPDYYIRWCASPAELARLQPSMVGGETLGMGAPPPEVPDVPPEIPTDLPIPLPVEATKEVPAAQAKAEPPPRPPAPTGDDSFFNAVARPGTKDGQ
jgi:hypothetical protein